MTSFVFGIAPRIDGSSTIMFMFITKQRERSRWTRTGVWNVVLALGQFHREELDVRQWDELSVSWGHGNQHWQIPRNTGAAWMNLTEALLSPLWPWLDPSTRSFEKPRREMVDTWNHTCWPWQTAGSVAVIGGPDRHARDIMKMSLRYTFSSSICLSAPQVFPRGQF